MASVYDIMEVGTRICGDGSGNGIGKRAWRAGRPGILAATDARMLFWAAHGGLPVDGLEDKPDMLDFWKDVKIRWFEDGIVDRLLEVSAPDAEKARGKYADSLWDWERWRGSYEREGIDCICPCCGEEFTVDEDGEVIDPAVQHEREKPYPNEFCEPLRICILPLQGMPIQMAFNAWYVHTILELAQMLRDPIRVGLAVLAPPASTKVLFVSADDGSWKFGLMPLRIDEPYPYYKKDEINAKIEIKEIEE